jgi:cobalt-zinc-cadmium resistance protein CzcA
LLDHNVSIQQYFQLGKITRNQHNCKEELAKLAEGAKALTEYEIEENGLSLLSILIWHFNSKKINM